jgi:hypothetical protein
MWCTTTGDESRKCSARTRGGRGAADEDEVRRPAVCGWPDPTRRTRGAADEDEVRRPAVCGWPDPAAARWGSGVQGVGTEEWSADASEWRGRV